MGGLLGKAWGFSPLSKSDGERWTAWLMIIAASLVVAGVVLVIHGVLRELAPPRKPAPTLVIVPPRPAATRAARPLTLPRSSPSPSPSPSPIVKPAPPVVSLPIPPAKAQVAPAAGGQHPAHPRLAIVNHPEKRPGLPNTRRRAAPIKPPPPPIHRTPARTKPNTRPQPDRGVAVIRRSDLRGRRLEPLVIPQPSDPQPYAPPKNPF